MSLTPLAIGTYSLRNPRERERNEGHQLANSIEQAARPFPNFGKSTLLLYLLPLFSVLLLSLVLTMPPGPGGWRFVDETARDGRSIVTFRTVELAQTPSSPLAAADKPPAGSKRNTFCACHRQMPIMSGEIVAGGGDMISPTVAMATG